MLKLISIIAIYLCLTPLANAQSFNKGSLLVSLSEGSTFSHFTVHDNEASPGSVRDFHIRGDRDPIIVEYGISRKWGIGICLGGDVFHTDPSAFYPVGSNEKKVTTSELTLEGNYHIFNTKKWDLGGCLSLGMAGVQFRTTGTDGHPTDYLAGGNIIRLSGKARYYIVKRFGILGILSTYAARSAPDPTKNNSILKQTTTSVSGIAYEFGLCYRILR